MLCSLCTSSNRDGLDAAKSLISQLCSLLKSGGFHLIKFLSNSVEVLSSVPQENLARNIDLKCSGLPAQKVLGVYWDPATDRMMVKVGVKQRSCTRRDLMSMIAQTYDPMDLIQPFLLPARQLLKEACRVSLQWDDDLADVLELGMLWQKMTPGITSARECLH